MLRHFKQTLLRIILTFGLLAAAGGGRIGGTESAPKQIDSKSDHPKADILVTTLDDVLDPNDGLLSLREAIAEAANGARIGFDESLAGGDRTIRLKEGQLEIGKPLTIDAEPVGGITVDAGGKSIVFLIAELPLNF